MTASARASLKRLRRARSWPLRAYFVLLVAVFVVSAASAAFYVRTQTNADTRVAAEHEVRFAAKTAATQLGNFIVAQKTAVQKLASNPQIGKALTAPNGCSLSYQGLSGTDGSHLEIIRADGAVACSSLSSADTRASVGYRGASWLRLTLTAPLSIAPLFDPRSARFVALYAVPIAGHLGVVAGFADLTSVGRVLASLYSGGHPDKFLITTADSRQIVAHSVDPTGSIGHADARSPFPPAGTSFEQRDLNGTLWLYAETTVSGIGWRLYVGEDAAAAFAVGQRLETRELGIIVAGLALVLLAAWFVYRNLALPLRRLSQSVGSASAFHQEPLARVSGPAEVTKLAGEIRGLIASVGRELTARERAEKSAGAILDATLDAVITIDHGGLIVEFNPSAEREFGRARTDVLGVEMASLLIPQAARDAHRRGLKHLVEHGEGPILDTRVEVTGLRADGTEFPIELTVTRAAIDGDLLFTAHIRDISKRVYAEQARNRSEEKYRLLFESNPNAMWVLDSETRRFLAVNDAAIHRYGYSGEEFSAMTLESIFAPEEAPRLREYLLRSPLDGANGLTHAGVWRHRLKNGTVIDAELTAHDLEFEGRAARVVLAHDVTERARTDQALRRSEARFRDLFENASDLIATVDLDERLTAVNEAFARRLGYTQEELIGRPIREFVPPEWHEQLEQAGQGKFTHQVEATTYEHELVASDGHRIPVEVASRVVEEDGRPVGIQAICRDLGDRQRADKLEGQLRQAQRLESVGKLAGGIAHDFNNLLTVISGYAEALLERHDPASATELGEIAAAATRATTLTRQLLAFSRRQVLQPQVIDLNTIVNGMTPMLARLIGEDIELAAPLDPGLDSVLADPGQIEQILLNLVVNARDAMPRGGRLTIETGNVELDDAYLEQHPEATPGRHAMLAVTDTGTGMTPDIIAQVFEPFFTTKPVGSGTGLGLSTVYGIVKQSGGSIWIYSEPGKGSSFKVYLPAVHAPSILQPRSKKPALVPNGTETILLVEDEQALRALTARMLATRGYSVITAETPHDALDLIEEHEHAIDLLLTDLVMPEMDGRELARRITEQAATVRVLFMSGYADQSVNRNGGLDLATFLEKPFSAADLARKVRQVLDAPADRPRTAATVAA